ncbi:hypothetical protein ASC64_02375 [Nocardioides sp. Root122]|uniref:hypothetical protein n=1 Tax=Nocardioides TaxID=1839 RepID=UPI000702D9B5|nr:MULTISPECIES: hypothetical protein [Nocardioides]KQV77696.1 hypothetical protein ASC64_02375 [Nocardioides sp. Root122]MCK9822155.1 hypothetical protein [Nocardioides cavernae]
MEEYGVGAWPLQGFGPREGLPPGTVWPSRREDEGGPTEWQTRSGAFRRTSRGLWVAAEVQRTLEQRIVEAAACLPSYGAVTGWAALRWQRAMWFQGSWPDQTPRPVALAVGDQHALRPQLGLQVSQEILPPGTIRRVRGLRVTSALWSVAYEMRKAPSEEAAVVAFELAALHDLVSIAELAAYVDTALWVRQGVPRIRALLPHLDENSWSPTEPIMRRTWCLSHHPRPLTNHPVFTRDGRFVGTPDLLDPDAGVYGMYDGALHLAGKARQKDVVKEAAYRALGLEGVTMMAGDLADREPFVARLREAYTRAAHRPPERRRWSTELPHWWIPTFTVEQRRRLSPEQRVRLLGYRPAA